MKKTLFQTLVAAALLGLAVTDAGAQSVDNVITAVTVPAVVVKEGTSNVVSQPFDIRPGYGVGFGVKFNGTNTGTDALTFSLQLSQDGTNWTTGYYTFAPVQNGTNTVIAYTNFPASLIDAAKQIRLATINNANTNYSLFVSNVFFSRPLPWPITVK